MLANNHYCNCKLCLVNEDHNIKLSDKGECGARNTCEVKVINSILSKCVQGLNGIPRFNAQVLLMQLFQ